MSRDTLKMLHDAKKNEEPEPEPVAFYVYKSALSRGNLMHRVTDNAFPWVYDQDPSSGYEARMLVYTAPPKKEWVGLMDEEIIDIWAGVSTGYDDEINIVHLGKAIEANLKEKNT